MTFLSERLYKSDTLEMSPSLVLIGSNQLDPSALLALLVRKGSEVNIIASATSCFLELDLP